MTKTIPALLATLMICSSQSAFAEYIYSYQNNIQATETIYLSGGPYYNTVNETLSMSLLFADKLLPNTVYGDSDVLAYTHAYVDDASYSSFSPRPYTYVNTMYLKTNELGLIADWHINFNDCGCTVTYSSSTNLDYLNLNRRISIIEGSTTQTSTWLETYSDKPFPIATPVPEPETYAMLLAGLGLVGFVSRRKQS